MAKSLIGKKFRFNSSKNVPKVPSARNVKKVVLLRNVIGQAVYFHKVYGRKNTGAGIERETQAFDIVAVQHLTDGKPAYRVRCQLDVNEETFGYIVPVDDVMFLEVGA